MYRADEEGPCVTEGVLLGVLRMLVQDPLAEVSRLLAAGDCEQVVHPPGVPSAGAADNREDGAPVIVNVHRYRYDAAHLLEWTVLPRLSEWYADCYGPLLAGTICPQGTDLFRRAVACIPTTPHSAASSSVPSAPTTSGDTDPLWALFCNDARAFPPSFLSCLVGATGTETVEASASVAAVVATCTAAACLRLLATALLDAQESLLAYRAAEKAVALLEHVHATAAGLPPAQLDLFILPYQKAAHNATSSSSGGRAQDGSATLPEHIRHMDAQYQQQKSSRGNTAAVLLFPDDHATVRKASQAEGGRRERRSVACAGLLIDCYLFMAVGRSRWHDDATATRLVGAAHRLASEARTARHTFRRRADLSVFGPRREGRKGNNKGDSGAAIDALDGGNADHPLDALRVGAAAADAAAAQKRGEAEDAQRGALAARIAARRRGKGAPPPPPPSEPSSVPTPASALPPPPPSLATTLPAIPSPDPTTVARYGLLCMPLPDPLATEEHPPGDEGKACAMPWLGWSWHTFAEPGPLQQEADTLAAFGSEDQHQQSHTAATFTVPITEAVWAAAVRDHLGGLHAGDEEGNGAPPRLVPMISTARLLAALHAGALDDDGALEQAEGKILIAAAHAAAAAAAAPSAATSAAASQRHVDLLQQPVSSHSLGGIRAALPPTSSATYNGISAYYNSASTIRAAVFCHRAVAHQARTVVLPAAMAQRAVVLQAPLDASAAPVDIATRILAAVRCCIVREKRAASASSKDQPPSTVPSASPNKKPSQQQAAAVADWVASVLALAEYYSAKEDLSHMEHCLLAVQWCLDRRLAALATVGALPLHSAEGGEGDDGDGGTDDGSVGTVDPVHYCCLWADLQHKHLLLRRCVADEAGKLLAMAGPALAVDPANGPGAAAATPPGGGRDEDRLAAGLAAVAFRALSPAGGGVRWFLSRTYLNPLLLPEAVRNAPAADRAVFIDSNFSDCRVHVPSPNPTLLSEAAPPAPAPLTTLRYVSGIPLQGTVEEETCAADPAAVIRRAAAAAMAKTTAVTTPSTSSPSSLDGGTETSTQCACGGLERNENNCCWAAAGRLPIPLPGLAPPSLYALVAVPAPSPATTPPPPALSLEQHLQAATNIAVTDATVAAFSGCMGNTTTSTTSASLTALEDGAAAGAVRGALQVLSAAFGAEPMLASLSDGRERLDALLAFSAAAGEAAAVMLHAKQQRSTADTDNSTTSARTAKGTRPVVGGGGGGSGVADVLLRGDEAFVDYDFERYIVLRRAEASAWQCRYRLSLLPMVNLTRRPAPTPTTSSSTSTTSSSSGAVTSFSIANIPRERDDIFLEKAIAAADRITATGLCPRAFRNVVRQADYDRGHACLEVATLARERLRRLRALHHNDSGGTANPSTTKTADPDAATTLAEELLDTNDTVAPSANAAQSLEAAAMATQERRQAAFLQRALAHFTAFTQGFYGEIAAAHKAGKTAYDALEPADFPTILLGEMQCAQVLLRLRRLAEARTRLQQRVLGFIREHEGSDDGLGQYPIETADSRQQATELIAVITDVLSKSHEGGGESTAAKPTGGAATATSRTSMATPQPPTAAFHPSPAAARPPAGATVGAKKTVSPQPGGNVGASPPRPPVDGPPAARAPQRISADAAPSLAPTSPPQSAAVVPSPAVVGQRAAVPVGRRVRPAAPRANTDQSQPPQPPTS